MKFFQFAVILAVIAVAVSLPLEEDINKRNPVAPPEREIKLDDKKGSSVELKTGEAKVGELKDGKDKLAKADRESKFLGLGLGVGFGGGFGGYGYGFGGPYYGYGGYGYPYWG